VIAGAEKSKAGCARRRLGKVPKDPGSIPGISTIFQYIPATSGCGRVLLEMGIPVTKRADSQLFGAFPFYGVVAVGSLLSIMHFFDCSARPEVVGPAEPAAQAPA
jgi:hypothetical protein